MTEIFIDAQSLNELTGIFKRLYPNAIVWVFGSRLATSRSQERLLIEWDSAYYQ